MSPRSTWATLLLLGACRSGEAAPGASASPGGAAPPSAPPPPAASASAAAAPSASAAPRELERDDLPELDAQGKTLAEQRESVLARMKELHGLDEAQLERMRAVFAKSKMLGQGNPEVTAHPMTRKACLDKRREAGVKDEREPLCRAPYMVPLYDPKTQKKDDAKVCIDRFEFPGLPCDYPLTWVTWKQGEELCKIMGKRMCDAHEWEGACAGALRPPSEEYAFGQERKQMRNLHNRDREIVWAYGPKKDHGKCGTSSKKSKKCESSGWKTCGSNTFPAGSFPECKSSFGVYDLHGNAAEHMALPLLEKKLGQKGGSGDPEMKGSWFVFQQHEAHPDDCRWRAPAWHDNEGKNHANYHLSFRCCKDVGG